MGFIRMQALGLIFSKHSKEQEVGSTSRVMVVLWAIRNSHNEFIF